MLDPAGRGLHRILMSVDTAGGVWTFALELARELAAQGLEVTLASMGELPAPSQREAAARLAGVNLVESEYKLEWMDRPWLDVLAAGEWLLEIEDRLRPDVVHLNGYAHATLPWRAPVLVTAHACACSWHEAVCGTPAGPEWDTYRHEVACGLKNADAVAAPSAFMLAALRGHYGFTGPGRVIYNGRQAGKRQPLGKEPFIFSVGRLGDEAKNLAALEAAGRELPWPVFVAGEPGRPGVNQSGLDHLISIGQLPSAEIADWMGRAMIFALPALYEPFSVTALEAALADCPLVLGDIASLREIWGDDALYVAPRDHVALTRTLERLMTDAALREEYGDRAHQRAAELTPARMTREYLALYFEMLEHKHLDEAGGLRLEA